MMRIYNMLHTQKKKRIFHVIIRIIDMYEMYIFV